MPTNITPYNERSERHGYWESYFSNGQLSFRGEYVNGLPHGVHESYWPNGKLGLVTNYLNGKAVGLYIAYYSSGVSGEKKFYAN